MDVLRRFPFVKELALLARRFADAVLQDEDAAVHDPAEDRVEVSQDKPAKSDGPPAHWLADIATLAPHLVQDGQLVDDAFTTFDLGSTEVETNRFIPTDDDVPRQTHSKQSEARADATRSRASVREDDPQVAKIETIRKDKPIDFVTRSKPERPREASVQKARPQAVRPGNVIPGQPGPIHAPTTRETPRPHVRVSTPDIEVPDVTGVSEEDIAAAVPRKIAKKDAPSPRVVAKADTKLDPVRAEVRQDERHAPRQEFSRVVKEKPDQARSSAQFVRKDANTRPEVLPNEKKRSIETPATTQQMPGRTAESVEQPSEFRETKSTTSKPQSFTPTTRNAPVQVDAPLRWPQHRRPFQHERSMNSVPRFDPRPDPWPSLPPSQNIEADSSGIVDLGLFNHRADKLDKERRGDW